MLPRRVDNLIIRKATEQNIPAMLRLYHETRIDGEAGFTVEEATARFVSEPLSILQSLVSFE